MNELATIDTMLQQSSEGFAKTLSQYKWELLPDSQIQAAKQALTKNDYIMKIASGDPGAVHDSLIKAAILGLDLTEGKKQGWLLPRKNQHGKTVIVLQVGYKGVEAIHQRMGVIDRLSIRVVRENDDFTWSGDDSDKPVHEAKPNWFATNEERGPVSGAFAITYFPDGSTSTAVTPISVIFGNHRDRSDSYKSYLAKKAKGGYAHPPPWVSDEQSMIEKTMAFIAAKQWPANNRNNEMSSKILETLHEIDVSDYSLQFTKEQRDHFFSFMDNDDPLGVYLFGHRVGIEVLAAICNTFEKGMKTKKRQQQRDMSKLGQDLWFDILKALDTNDEGLLLESMDGCLVITEKMVKAALDDRQKKIFEALTEVKYEVLEDKTKEAVPGKSDTNEVVADIQSESVLMPEA